MILSENLLEELRAIPQELELSKLLSPLERHFRVELPEVEWRYIQVFFLAANGRYLISAAEKKYAKTLITSAIAAWSNALNRDLTQDRVLHKDLYESLLPIFTRFVFGIHVINPFLNAIRTHYASFFPLVADSIKSAEHRYGFQSSDDELAFIVLNLVSALNRSIGPLRALLYCHCEYPVRIYTCQALEQNFANLVIELEDSLFAIQNRELKAFDLIITTSPLELSLSIPIVLIHPLLTGKDYARLWQLIYDVRESKLSESKNCMNEVS